MFKAFHVVRAFPPPRASAALFYLHVGIFAQPWAQPAFWLCQRHCWLLAESLPFLCGFCLASLCCNYAMHLDAKQAAAAAAAATREQFLLRALWSAFVYLFLCSLLDSSCPTLRCWLWCNSNKRSSCYVDGFDEVKEFGTGSKTMEACSYFGQKSKKPFAKQKF